MRYLFVTTYPPVHCGIGMYAAQSVDALRAQGHLVDVVSPDGAGQVDFAWNLKGGVRLLKLVKLLPFYDRVVIQYQWSLFYHDLPGPTPVLDTLVTTLSFVVLFLLGWRKIEVMGHEILALRHVSRWSPKKLLYRLKWTRVPRLYLHTARERQEFLQNFPVRFRPDRVQVRPHHTDFRRYKDGSREAARRELGLPDGAPILLCIGFVQWHKGFDQAIRAFRRVGAPDARLYVVGSIRTETPENLAYRSELRRLAAGSSRVHVVDVFLSDEEFDAWIIASDWIVLPYREIWSSGVLARARLFERRSIVSNVGGLPDQAAPGDLMFGTDEEFDAALSRAMSLTRAERATARADAPEYVNNG